MYWGRDLVIAIQTFTYEVWKMRNEVLHGKDAKENREIKLAKCRERIRELHKLDRGCLSMEDKKFFKLPMRLWQKLGLSAMRQWIETMEYLFQKKMENEKKNKYYGISQS